MNTANITIQRQVSSGGFEFTATYDFAGCTVEILAPVFGAAMAVRLSQPLIKKLKGQGKTDEEILSALITPVKVKDWALKANVQEAKAQAKLAKSTENIVEASKGKTDEEKRKMLEDLAKQLGL